MKLNRRTFLKFLGITVLGALTIVSSFPLKAQVGADRKQGGYRTGRRKEVAGETKNWLKAKVFDADTGEELIHVVSADERTGRVVRFGLDKDGGIRHSQSGVSEETEYRRIRIERPV